MPQISFSPLLFYSLNRSLLAVQTLLEVQDAEVPAQGSAGDRGLPNRKVKVFILGWILIFSPHLVLNADPLGGGPASTAVKKWARNLGEQRRGCRSPQRKSFIGAARHDPTGSLRHPHQPGCKPREGYPKIPAAPQGRVQRGVPGTASCCQCSRGHHPIGEGLLTVLQREMNPPTPSLKSPPAWVQLCSHPAGWATVLFSKACPCPV